MNEQHKPKFKGWWVPVDIVQMFEQKEITATELILLATIDSLCDTKDGCFASNKYLAKRVHVTERWVKIILSKFVDELGVVKRVTRDDGSRGLVTLWSRWRRRSAVIYRSPRGCITDHPGGDLKITPSPSKEGCIKQENRQDDQRARPRSGLLGESFEDKASKHLQETIRLEYDITKPIKEWPKVFFYMQKDGISQSRIKAVLKWYRKGIGYMWVKKVEEARQFKYNFGSIEKAMKAEGAKKGTNLSDDAKKALAELRELHWPQIARTQLPEAVQSTIDAYNKWNKRRTEAMKDCSNNMLQATNRCLHGIIIFKPARFAVEWFAQINRDKQNWQEWEGHIRNLAFTPEQPQFRKMALETLSDSEWERFIKFINEN